MPLRPGRFHLEDKRGGAQASGTPFSIVPIVDDIRGNRRPACIQILWFLKLETDPSRCRRLRNMGHRGGQCTAISAIDGEAVERRANHRLRCPLIGNVAIVDRLEHVGMIFIRHHVNFGVDVETLDRAALIGDSIVRKARRETAAFDDRRVVLALGNVIDTGSSSTNTSKP